MIPREQGRAGSPGLLSLPCPRAGPSSCPLQSHPCCEGSQRSPRLTCHLHDLWHQLHSLEAKPWSNLKVFEGKRGRGYDPTPSPTLRKGELGGKAKGCGVCPAGRVPLRGSALAFRSSARAPWGPKTVGEPQSPFLHHPDTPCSHTVAPPSPSRQLQDFRELGLGFQAF